MRNRLIKILTDFIRSNDGLVYKSHYLSLLYIVEKLSQTASQSDMQELFDRIQSDPKRYLSSPLEIDKLFTIIYHREDEPLFIYEEFDMEEKIGGLYFIYDEYDNLIYIGKSERNLYNRSLESFSHKTLYGSYKIKLLPVDFVEVIGDLENDFIMLYKPLFNQTETKVLSNNSSQWFRYFMANKRELDESKFYKPVRLTTEELILDNSIDN